MIHPNGLGTVAMYHLFFLFIFLIFFFNFVKFHPFVVAEITEVLRKHKFTVLFIKTTGKTS